MDLLLKLAEDGAVDIKWEKGDLVLLDVSICLRHALGENRASARWLTREAPPELRRVAFPEAMEG